MSGPSRPSCEALVFIDVQAKAKESSRSRPLVNIGYFYMQDIISFFDLVWFQRAEFQNSKRSEKSRLWTNFQKDANMIPTQQKKSPRLIHHSLFSFLRYTVRYKSILILKTEMCCWNIWLKQMFIKKIIEENLWTAQNSSTVRKNSYVIRFLASLVSLFTLCDLRQYSQSLTMPSSPPRALIFY